VREMNAAGVRTSKGKPWIASGLRNLLKTGRIAGVREHHGELVMKEVMEGEPPKPVKAAWPAIVTLAECKRLRALLSDPNRRSLGRGTARSYLLTGFIHCGRKTCGTPLVARPKAGGLRCYMCAHDVRRPKACGQLTTRAEPVEELVTAQLFKMIDSPTLARAVAEQSKTEKHERTKAKEAAEVIAEVEALRDDLMRDLANGKISRREWLVAKEPLERRLAAAQNEFSAEQRTAVLEGFIGKSGALRRAWRSMTIDRQRAILAVVIERVDIAPVGRKHGPSFDPSRVSVRWRY
jgi:site-specific DNA recombinase